MEASELRIGNYVSIKNHINLCKVIEIKEQTLSSMNTLVNLEIAKLLKEKGFDLPCNNYTSQRDGDYFSNEKQTISYKNYNEITSTYSRPTIAEVVMWLYEKHGVWISVLECNGSTHGFYYKVKQSSGVSSDEFNSPTEAYLEAIIYTLKNLI